MKLGIQCYRDPVEDLKTEGVDGFASVPLAGRQVQMLIL